MQDSEYESNFYFDQVYRLRQGAIYFAVLCLLIFIYLDTVRFSQPLLNQVIFLRIMVQLLPILIILVASILQFKQKIEKQVYYWIASTAVFIIGMGHAEILVTAYKSSHFFPKVGMAIILYYAGILLALPLLYAIISSTAIIVYATYAYAAVGIPKDEVISTCVFYAVFAACCIFMNTVTSKMIKNNIKLVKHINKQAQTDAVTQLTNRRAFFEHSEQVIKQSYRTQEPFALLIIDLDNFKKVNDLLGHYVGDEVLIKVAQILVSHSKRPLDLASRFGGDEFVLLLYGINDVHTKDVCTQIIFEVEQIAKELASNHPEIKLGISIGVVFNDVKTTPNINNLIETADKALYHVKNNGKNSFSIATMERYISSGSDSDSMSVV